MVFKKLTERIGKNDDDRFRKNCKQTRKMNGMRWHGYVLRMDVYNVAGRALNVEVVGRNELGPTLTLKLRELEVNSTTFVDVDKTGF